MIEKTLSPIFSFSETVTTPISGTKCLLLSDVQTYGIDRTDGSDDLVNRE